MIDLQCLLWAQEGEVLTKCKQFARQHLKVEKGSIWIAGLGPLLLMFPKSLKGNRSDFDSKPLKSD